MIPNHLFDKYLKLLDVERSSPSYQMLCQIIKTHLIRVPFENISKLLYKKQGLNYIPDLHTYLDGIEKINLEERAMRTIIFSTFS